jgi:NAD(P)-dependent dehydrogenase (short-subunit alcohol dehydrogenase family)
MALKNEYQGLLVFLLSNASSYVNGAVIAADGGRTAW